MLNDEDYWAIRKSDWDALVVALEAARQSREDEGK